MSTLFLPNFMDLRAAELDCSETGCQTLLGIETPHIHVLKLINDVAFVYIYDLFNDTISRVDCTGSTVAFVGE
jgi:hypothetical protein